MWKCDFFQKANCHARLHTTNHKIVKRVNVHTHQPDFGRCEAAVILAVAKTRAKESEDAAQEIANEAYTNLSPDVIGKLPKLDSIKRAVRKIRNKKQTPVTNDIFTSHFLA